ncbi:hypothetical protein QJS10_CPB19g00591 [Acorus calamus]|uniref:DDE Tnp4 domain-containing protein n=1 Tax=Acorus calamus TaxID=4465 RepID=A0AAV9CGS9_ACOCL|nr:hypothetical protein QJS10_CPB19g00591 [Acorus calamus]
MALVPDWITRINGEMNTPSLNLNKKMDTTGPPTSTTTTIPLLNLLSTASTSSSTFLTKNDHLLLPSQSLLLESTLLHLHSLLSLPPPPPPPTTTPHWFLRLSSSSSSSDPLWSDSFHMSKPTFLRLLQILTPSLSFSPSPDHKLAAALFRLAHAAPFPSVSARFAFPSPSDAFRAFYEIVKALIERLSHLFSPSSSSHNAVRFPDCLGVLAFCRFSGTVAQALVDFDGRFVDVSAGWPGRLSPHEIVPRTRLLSRSELFSGGGGTVKKYVLGGTCCPLSPWLLRPYSSAETAVGKEDFNLAHSESMGSAEGVFRKVRSRWRLLRSDWSGEFPEAVPFVVIAVCLLHNFMVSCGEPMMDGGGGGGDDDDDDDIRAAMEFKEFVGLGVEEGRRARDAVALHLKMLNGTE